MVESKFKYYISTNLSQIHRYFFQVKIPNDLKKVSDRSRFFFNIPSIESYCQLPSYMKDFFCEGDQLNKNFQFNGFSILKEKFFQFIYNSDVLFFDHKKISSLYQRFLLKEAFQEVLRNKPFKSEFEKVFLSFDKVNFFLLEILSISNDLKQFFFGKIMLI